MTEQQTRFNKRQEVILTWFGIALVASCCVTLAGTWVLVIVLSLDDLRKELLAQHFVAIVGLPAQGAAAFLLVSVFRYTEGPIEFEAFTIKFKGAGGPIALWILCFLSMVGAVKLVW